jgi:hypothetical protein
VRAPQSVSGTIAGDGHRYGRNTRLSDKQYRRLMQPTGAVSSRQRAGTGSNHPSPRRSRRRDWRSTFGAGTLGLVFAGFIAYNAVERFPEYLGPVAAATAVQTVSGPVSHVRDGDTIVVAGTPIRFGSSDCAERDTAEGRRASAKMSELVAGHTVTCHLNGRSSYDRGIGSCRLDDGRDLAAQMIGSGYCSRYW